MRATRSHQAGLSLSWYRRTCKAAVGTAVITGPMKMRGQVMGNLAPSGSLIAYEAKVSPKSVPATNRMLRKIPVVQYSKRVARPLKSNRRSRERNRFSKSVVIKMPPVALSPTCHSEPVCKPRGGAVVGLRHAHRTCSGRYGDGETITEEVESQQDFGVYDILGGSGYVERNMV